MQVAGQRFGGMTDSYHIQEHDVYGDNDGNDDNDDDDDNDDNDDDDDNDDNDSRIEVWSNDRRIVDDPGFMRRVCSILGLRL